MTSAGTPAPAAKAKQSRTTDYVILVQEPGDSFWREQPTSVAATSAEQAIRKHVEDVSKPEGLYVAVPKRSFAPTKVTRQVQTTIKLATA